MPADAAIESILRRAFPGCRVDACVRLEGGVSARAMRADVVCADGTSRRVVVRRPTGDTPLETRLAVAREHGVLTQIAARGIHAPTPIFHDETAAAVVIEYLDGNPDFAPRNLMSLVESMATELARIHDTPHESELGFLPRRVASTAENLLHAPPHLDETLDESGLRATLGRLWPWPQHNADALLHGDFWPGNVLWRDERLVAVLDWEEAEIGDPLSDVAVTRLDLLWAYGEAAMHAFTDRYRAQTALDWCNLPHWDLVAALRPMSKLTLWAPAYAEPSIGRPDITEEVMRAEHRRFVAQALTRHRHGDQHE